MGIGVADANLLAKLNIAGTVGMYGTGLDGSASQRFTMQSDVTNGLLFNAPKDAAGTKLPISFNWQGGGTTPFSIRPNGRIGIGTTSPGLLVDVYSQNSLDGMQLSY